MAPARYGIARYETGVLGVDDDFSSIAKYWNNPVVRITTIGDVFG